MKIIPNNKLYSGGRSKWVQCARAGVAAAAILGWRAIQWSSPPVTRELVFDVATTYDPVYPLRTQKVGDEEYVTGEYPLLKNNNPTWEAKTDPRKMVQRERYPMDNERHVLTVYWEFVWNMASQIILWLHECKFRITSQHNARRGRYWDGRSCRCVYLCLPSAVRSIISADMSNIVMWGYFPPGNMTWCALGATNWWPWPLVTGAPPWHGRNGGRERHGRLRGLEGGPRLGPLGPSRRHQHRAAVPPSTGALCPGMCPPSVNAPTPLFVDIHGLLLSSSHEYKAMGSIFCTKLHKLYVLTFL